LKLIFNDGNFNNVEKYFTIDKSHNIYGLNKRYLHFWG